VKLSIERGPLVYVERIDILGTRRISVNARLHSPKMPDRFYIELGTSSPDVPQRDLSRSSRPQERLQAQQSERESHARP
jgi:hypothetical protein